MKRTAVMFIPHVVTVLCFFPGAFTSTAQPIASVSETARLPRFESEFRRVFDTGSSSDVISGRIFYLGPEQLRIEVDSPVQQVMYIDNAILETSIYYPATNRGFLLKGKVPAVVPIVPGVLASARPDYGLEQLGFEIYDQSFRSDTLITYWAPSNDEQNVGTFELIQINGRLRQAKYRAADGSRTLTTTLSQYISTGNFFIPQSLETQELTPEGEKFESIILSNTEFNPDFPSHILSFEFPRDAVVEKKNW